MKVVGVDLSTKKISAIAISERMIEWEIEVRGKLADDRFPQLSAAFAAFLRSEQPDVVYVEGLPFVKNREAIVGLASVLGAIKASCAIYGVRCVVVPGYEWKRTLGIGQTKEKVSDWVKSNGLTFRSQDLTDAYAIARYGIAVESAGPQ